MVASTKVAESFDFFNPFMAAKIITGDGVEYPLWSGGAADQVGFGSGIDSALGPEYVAKLQSLAYLTEISIEMDLGFIPKITAVLNPPLEEAIKLLNTDLVEIGENRLQVQFGYARGANGAPVTQKYEAMIFGNPQISIGADCSISLSAQGANGAASTRHQQSALTFPDKTRKAILDEIGATYGLKFVIGEDTLKDATSGPMLTEEKVTKSIGWKSVLFFVTQLVNEARCFLRWGGRTEDLGEEVVEVVSRTAAFVKTQPAIVLSLFGFSSTDLPGQTVYPVLSVQSFSNALFLPGVQKVVMADIDAKSKKSSGIFAIPINDAKPAQTWGGTADVVGGKAPLVPEGAVHHAGSPNDRAMVEHAKAAFQSYTVGSGTSLEVETIGVPTIQPGAVIMLRGLGKKFDGIYAATKINHSLGASGFTTRLVMTKNLPEILAPVMRGPADNSNQNKNTEAKDGGDSTKAEAKPQ